MKNTTQYNKNTILNYGKYYLNKKKILLQLMKKVLHKNVKNTT